MKNTKRVPLIKVIKIKTFNKMANVSLKVESKVQRVAIGFLIIIRRDRVIQI